MTAAQRQKAFKARMAEAGLVQINVWAPAGALPQVQQAAELMRDNPELTIDRLVNTRTGRLVSLRKGQ